MRLFQMMGFGPTYLRSFERRRLAPAHAGFEARKSALLADRNLATHILKPVHDRSPDAFFTVCDDATLQAAWARERGLARMDATEILLAQIEQHRAEVVYNNHPIGFPSSFVRRLPGCVKATIAWRAAPSAGADLSAYTRIVSNFDTLNALWQGKGWRTAKFYPSHDPEMDAYAGGPQRATDVFFAGSYARSTGHAQRITELAAISSLCDSHRVDLRLLVNNWGRLKDASLLRWVPVPIRLPKPLRHVKREPVFGREMYLSLGSAKVVLNPATDIAGSERGNMRCWEALGCGSCMVASAGTYPEGFEAGINFVAYQGEDDLLRKTRQLLCDAPLRRAIAEAGKLMMKRVWSKERQWTDFNRLAASL